MHIYYSLLKGDIFPVHLSTPLLQEKISYSKHNLKPNIYNLLHSCFNSSKINALPVISGTSPYNTHPETWPKWVKFNSGTLIQIFVENKIQILTSDPDNYCTVDLQSLFIIFISLFLGLGTMTWSPLACGILTGKYEDGIPCHSRAALKVNTTQRLKLV